MSEEAKSKRVKASQKVEVAVEKYILSGEWAKGTRLPSEDKLCKKFDVSRTAVREALRELRGKGLLETINGSGSYVSGGSIENLSKAISAYSVMVSDRRSISELLDMRSAIEGDSAAKLAQRKDSAAHERLVKLHNELIETVGKKTFPTADQRFHKELLKSSGNRLYALLGDALKDRYQRYVKEAYSDDLELQEVTIEEHQSILDAIASGDPREARQAVREHIDNARIRWEKGTDRAR
ncbi:DNA-binding transcriptional regulator, FadR family [Rubritalea squalenifaciens DSM 18772]|uniref:DNA-binding transcriptional regulator, FadR family n=2 Tax=Rubritalea TaxID=361050 RepID=A0A1M6NGG2_9BACT|nr:FadR/GntR family transcriptional regulator [Rubritalea squalenifaciens]SHJ94706.1 DNA-binding transcriptional regulator, FadR family [Rubritalea squalenifaciens DSM 18772]